MGFSAGNILSPFLKDQELRKSLKRIFGYTPRNIELYKKALKHRSVAKNEADSNERLEFLGDSVLGAVVSECLFARFPYKNEGFLTKMRSKIVNRSYLNALAKRIGISEIIEYQAGQHDRFSSLHGDAFEALIGALFVDRGYPVVKKFVTNRLFQYFIDLDEIENQDDDYKSRLINFCQREKLIIKFQASEAGKGRGKYFKVVILIDGEEKGSGEGQSKKRAEQNASRLACTTLRLD